MARIGSTAVRQGLAKRAQPKRTAQSTGGGGTDYASRFLNPGAGTNRARTVDRSRFQNPGVGTRPAPAPRTAPAPRATRKVDPAQTTVHRGYSRPQTAGAPPQTPGRPGGRFGAWQPRTAQAVRPAAAPMQPMPARQPMQVAQAAPQPVPGQYQPPGRPMAPQMAQPVYPQPQPQMAQPFYPQPAPQVAQPVYPQPQVAQPFYPQPQTAQPFYPQQVYNPTPYNPWR